MLIHWRVHDVIQLYLSFEFNVFKGYINHVEPPCFTVLESEEIPYVGACESPGRGQRS
jgi:hypothetical protein